MSRKASKVDLIQIRIEPFAYEGLNCHFSVLVILKQINCCFSEFTLFKLHRIFSSEDQTVKFRATHVLLVIEG